MVQSKEKQGFQSVTCYLFNSHSARSEPASLAADIPFFHKASQAVNLNFTILLSSFKILVKVRTFLQA